MAICIPCAYGLNADAKPLKLQPRAWALSTLNDTGNIWMYTLVYTLRVSRDINDRILPEELVYHKGRYAS